MHNTLFSQFQTDMQARWKPEWANLPGANALQGNMLRLVTAVAGLQETRRELDRSGKYSRQGLNMEIRSRAEKDVVPLAKQLHEEIVLTKRDVDCARRALALPEADPGNVSAAVLRSEMRTWLRSLPIGEALALLMKDDVEELLLIAALEVPSRMGPLGDAQEQLRDHVMKKRHGAALADLSEKEEVAGLVDAAVNISLYQLKQDAGFSEDDGAAFQAWFSGSAAN